MTDLSDTDRDILAFETSWFLYRGAKEQEIRERFDLSATAYYQHLNRIIDDPAAMAHDPMVVKRLQRLRSARQQTRSPRRERLN
jgi:hypothetical protein